MAAGKVIETVLDVAVIVATTGNVALFAFRPGSYRAAPWTRRVMGIITVAWVIFLPVGGVGVVAGALASGQQDAWLGIVTGGVALACWPVVILAVRMRSMTYRKP
jgi:hypothetical protein